MATTLPPVPTFPVPRTPDDLAKQFQALLDYIAGLKAAIEQALP